MRLGVQMPQGELSEDPAEIRAYAEAAVDLGFRHMQVVDHVLGAHRASHQELDYLPYDSGHLLHEPLVLFGFLAGCVPKLEVVTGVLILPQRQTALVAKQVAEVDVLNGGRTRVAVGTGWNAIEYEALGVEMRSRAPRLEEQIGLLRRLWTEPVVDFEGDFHRVDAAGINPLPTRRPVPIWIGGTVKRARDRAARLGDGYLMPWPLPAAPLESHWVEDLEAMRELHRTEGSTPEFGIEARILPDPERSPEQWRQSAADWRELGATHLSIRVTGLGLRGADAHIGLLESVAAALADLTR